MSMQQLMNMLGRNIVPIMFVLFATFGWIGKYIKAQQQAKAVKRAKEQRDLEGLRTGRVEAPSSPPPAPVTAPSAQASLEEIAARRRAKMDEMQRRRAGAQTQVSTNLPSASADAAKQELGRLLGQVLGVPTTPTPSRGSPRPPRQPSPRPQPVPRGQQQRRPAPPQPRPAPTLRQDSSAQKLAQSSQPTFAPAHNQNAPAHDPNAPVFSYAIGADKANRANKAASRRQRPSVLQGTNLRQLFVLREVFEKPISMREGEF